MLGLAAHQSSSEDKKDGANVRSAEKQNDKASPSAAPSESTSKAEAPPPPPPTTDDLSEKPLVGPARPVDTSSPPPETPVDEGQGNASDDAPPQALSPYAANRALVHDLTLPPVLNMDIPPSPPGSPDPAMESAFKACVAKYKDNGVNAELASSRDMRNPALLWKLMTESGVIGDDDGGAAQYATSLDKNIWDVTKLPGWGYKKELLASNAEIRRDIERQKKEKRARGERERPEFVPGGTGESGRLPGATTTKGGIGVSLSERIMEGVRRDERSSMVRRPHQGRRKGRSRSPRRR